MNRVLLLLVFIATTLVIQGDAFYGGHAVYRGGHVYWKLGHKPRHGGFRVRPQKEKNPIHSDVRQEATPAPQCENEYDVVIVGGGCGGVYSAWRLANDATTPRRSILLIEATNRIGGRVLSETMPNVNVSEAELGAMRFVRTRHVKLAAVVDYLGLETSEFLMDEGNDNRPYTIRNAVIKQGELTTSDLPYALFDNEVGKTADEIQYDVFEATVPLEDRDKPTDQMMTVYGYPLYNLGFRNAFTLANASEDALHYFEAMKGYSVFLNNLNAAWLMYQRPSQSESQSEPPAWTRERVVDGMEHIPQGLYDEFMNDAYAASQMGKTVTAINKLDSGKYAVMYEDTKEPAFKSVVCASDVILSLTRRQLQRIQWNAFKESKKAPLLDSVYSDIAYKLFLSFDSPPFWKDSEFDEFSLNQGRTVSTLPSQTTYYYTGEGEDDSMIMMYGNDAQAQFWADLAVNTDDDITTVPGPEVFFPTTEPMVAQALRQLAINHNTTVDRIGTPNRAMFQLWSPEKPIRVNNNAPEKYSIYYPSEPWHTWRAGYNFTDIWDDIIQLDPDQNVYLIGEAYSLNQGWIEGAFETADEMLKNVFDIPPIEKKGRRRRRNPRDVP